LGHTHALFGVASLVTVEILARDLTHSSLVQPHLIKGIPAGFILCAGAVILARWRPTWTLRSRALRELGWPGR